MTLRENFGLEECEDNDCTGCAYCDAVGITERVIAMPQGWQDALDTWMKIWRRSCAELLRKPHSCRAILVERTSYGRLCDLMAQRP